MRVFRNIINPYNFFLFILLPVYSFGQLGISFDVIKPKKYEDRELKSEKTGEKKFTLPRRLVQNTVTHYNYVFNATNKLNEVIEQAKQGHKDDFTQLLPFYNYSLDVTSQNKQSLDSIITKSSTGIVLHDLRNDWIDNLYLLTGAAYYLRKDFDSAYLTFQFVNYAFAEKEKDGYYKNIGSRFDGNNALSISTKEKGGVIRKVFSEPPSRNDAFIWQIRTFIAQEAYAEAASLIVTLRDDPKFPDRLDNDLEEVQALWFYRQNIYDSAAFHLEKALGNAKTKQDKARWEYLSGQLYEISNDYTGAGKMYEKVIGHTTDPVMEIYARLNAIKINKEGGEDYINKNIADLMKMARRDKYREYRDIIYYMAAQMELERNNTEAAKGFLIKSAANNKTNISLKNKAFLQLATFAYGEKNFRDAHSYYDSLKLDDPSLKNVEAIKARKDALTIIAGQIEIIERQDSLQRIASMPEEERNNFVKKLVKQLRKQQGLKDDQQLINGFPQDAKNAAPDLFSNNSSKGEWYFYNNSLKAKGTGDFKSKWGNRPNADNWRRMSAVSLQNNNNRMRNDGMLPNNGINAGAPPQPTEVSFENLYNNLPITAEQLLKSNDSIANAKFLLGKAYAEKIEECSLSTSVLEEYIGEYPKHEKRNEALFTLYYCYSKNGETTNAERIKALMQQEFPDNKLTTIVTTGKDPDTKEANPVATKRYEYIYDLFIEGKFDEALAEKIKADSIYGENFWTPQLLYIEAVYHVRNRNDSAAVRALTTITQKHSASPLAEKATNLINVLGRRSAIEMELTNMNIERPKEDSLQLNNDDTAVMINNKPALSEPVVKNNNLPVNKPATDTLKTAGKPVPANVPYRFKEDEKYYAVVLLEKVDVVWGNEAKNAFNRYNQQKFYNNPPATELKKINDDYKLLVIGVYNNLQEAIDYTNTVKPIAEKQIVPWLTASKFTFSVISDNNLFILENKKDIQEYKQFLEQHLPGKF